MIDGVVVLGRSTEAHLQFEDAEISRRHARIGWQPNEGYVVEDLDSRNGTFLNGSAVKRARLSYGDELRLGSRILLRFGQVDAYEEQLLQQERFQALGRLAAGVAHDVNNMLSAVSANIDWLHGLSPETQLSTPDVRESLSDIVTAANRAADLTRGILAFARGKGRGRSRVDFTALVVEVLKLLRHAVPRNVQVEAEIEPGLFVYGDRVELHQVLMNLCLNGRDAMPNGGMLSVKVAERAPTAVPGATGAVTSHVGIVVRDTGVGMDERTRSRIFEPFFSTKAEGAGVGLGLATVREVVRYHGGYIEVESELGRGSAFLVYLPMEVDRTPERWLVATAELVALDPIGGESTDKLILVVDDEAVVLRSLGRLLRRAGCEVIFASGGQEAIDIYTSGKRRPDLILMDLDMPGMTGEEACARLLHIDPEVRVIIMSGDHARGAQLEGVVGRIEKPCEAHVLVSEVRAALNESRELESELTSPR